MHQFHVQFHSLRDVQDFVMLASKQKYRLEVGSDWFQVNATSFMGIFALNCRKPQRVTVDCSQDEFEALKETFARFLAP
jgi:phosphotransferase system HPr-like phosphotransfer protein